MESNLFDIFEEARQLVAEADRRHAEAERQRRDIEAQAKRAELQVRFEACFDFTGREKLAFEPRMDMHGETAVVEFLVRSLRAIFVLLPKNEPHWQLLVAEDGKPVASLGDIFGGASEPNSRRLAAARVVASIAAWVDEHRAGNAPEVRAERADERVPELAEIGPPRLHAPEARRTRREAQALTRPEPTEREWSGEAGRRESSGPVWARPMSAAQQESGQESGHRPEKQATAVALAEDFDDSGIVRRPGDDSPMGNIVPAKIAYGTFGKFFGY